ncbi:hypothetical protein [Puerhibacterium sp. TATVAM-FAB25]|uniref:antitoxin VbhA family protein n=1 Tax=Puerhibacterium sp. TATVAM-FAB25 TaxID=3093699 RepID=UPI00397BF945
MRLCGRPTASLPRQGELEVAGERFDVEERWPELFDRLDVHQRYAVAQSLASMWHDGWVPSREDVENLTDRARGAIDQAEFVRRSREAAAHRQGPAPAP